MKKIYEILLQTIFIVTLIVTLCNCQKDDSVTQSSETTPSFSWDEESFLLDTDNGWAVTRFGNHIALTNYNEKSQYLISWNGNINNGDKNNPTLKIATVGKALQSIDLDKLSITLVNNKYYNITFSQYEKEGTLVIAR